MYGVQHFGYVRHDTVVYMAYSMKLNPRQQDILRATVRHYVSTAEPVGSKSLAKGYDLQVSSATIRNVMSALEESGLLYQPHTSAGRIPSDSGYRTYVNELMSLAGSSAAPLANQMRTALMLELDWESQAIEALLQESAQILSRLSGYIALVTLPQMNASLIKHLQLVRVSNQQILLVVLDIYDNHSVLLRLPSQLLSKSSDEVIDRELQILSNFLSDQLTGRSLQNADLNWSELDQTFQRYVAAIQGAIADLARKSRPLSSTQILVSGVADALDQPEFAERENIRSIVQLLEDGRSQIWPLIAAPASRTDSDVSSDLMPEQPTRIWIGSENPVEPMRSCALVTTRYGQQPGPMGSLGVLGPTRMLYENAVAAVEAAANYLTEAVSETLEFGSRLTPEG